MPTRARIRRSTRRRPEVVELTGRARLDRRTKHLVRRLTADDVAIIDHADLDRVSAEELVESGVRVVVNVSPSSTGQYLELGPLTLLRAAFGSSMRGRAALRAADRWRVGDGSRRLRLPERRLSRDRQVLDELELLHALDEQQARLADAISSLPNTMRYLREEAAARRGDRLRPSRTRFEAGTCSSLPAGLATSTTCASSGDTFATSSRCSSADGGADALRAAGYRPDVIVGDMDSVTDETLGAARSP